MAITASGLEAVNLDIYVPSSAGIISQSSRQMMVGPGHVFVERIPPTEIGGGVHGREHWAEASGCFLLNEMEGDIKSL